MFKLKSRSITPEEVKNKDFKGMRSKVALWKGDITKLQFDAIVNAANSSLLGGGGVDGAIHAAAGRQLYDECSTLDGCETGDAKITKGYRLPSKHVIHTVGPIGEKKEMLSSCYKTSLNVLKKNKLKTIAFPCISTGIYGYPNESAANVALSTVKNWLDVNFHEVDLIVFCLFLPTDVEIYSRLIKEYFPDSEDSTSVDPEPITKPANSKNEKSKKAQKQKDKTPPQLPSSMTDDIASMNLDKKSREPASRKSTKTGNVATKDQNVPSGKIDSQSIEIAPGRKRAREDKKKKKARNDRTDLEQLHGSSQSHSDSQPDTKVRNERNCDVEDKLKEVSDESLSAEEVQQKWIAKFKCHEKEAIEKVIRTDKEFWALDENLKGLKRVGGLDISYHKTCENMAYVTLVVLSFPKLEAIYEDTTLVKIDVPYIPGYLAYREAAHYQEKLKKSLETKFAPQVVLIDGNGVLHPRKFGCATAVGVECDIPTIGVAKNFLVMENFGINKDDSHKAKVQSLEKRGSAFDIVTNKNEIIGKALRTSDNSRSPVYVSVGHRCSLETAIRVTLACSKHRIPDPIRQADQLSKMKLRESFEKDFDNYVKLCGIHCSLQPN